MQTKGFFGDPLWKWIFPDENHRLNTLPKFFRVFNKIFCKFSKIFVVGDPIVGVAVWEFPGKLGTFIDKKEPPGFLKILFSRMLFQSPKALPIFHTSNKWHKKIAKPHYYLSLISVLPDIHGKGVGSALIKPILRRADKEYLPIYLETMNPKNLKLYGHFGFEIISHKYFEKPNLNLWGMLRQPKRQ